jgi:integrase
LLKARGESKKRPFTADEIKRILKACEHDEEWRGLILFGLYVGQRLGHLAKLTWRAINLDQCEIAFTTQKTGRRIVLPLVQPLVDYLTELPASDNPNAHVFPRAAKVKYVATLSNQFHDILEDAGLAQSRKYRRTDKERAHARQPTEISFHSLRHSAVTMLKAAGVSDFIARDIIGHDSAVVSRQYTHLSTEDKRRAMRNLPDVTE